MYRLFSDNRNLRVETWGRSALVSYRSVARVLTPTSRGLSSRIGEARPFPHHRTIPLSPLT